MKKIKTICKKLSALFVAGIIILAAAGAGSKNTYAADLEAGTYELSGEFSAYIAAMGGVEFGGPLLTGVSLIIDDAGDEYLYLTFSKSSVTIYSITCDTFIDPAPSTITTTRGIEDGTIGIYDSDGNLVTEGVTYTLSDDTALNSADEEVNYVDSITFPIDSRQETYNLALYVNSNVMGVEFCNENDDATESTYQCTLTVDWSNVEALEADADATTTQAATEETTEETTLEADEDLEGLAIYSVDDETDETDASEAASESSSSGMSTSAVIIIVVVIVIVIIVVIIIVAAARKKKKPEAVSEGGAADDTVVVKKADTPENSDKNQ